MSRLQRELEEVRQEQQLLWALVSLARCHCGSLPLGALDVLLVGPHAVVAPEQRKAPARDR